MHMYSTDARAMCIKAYIQLKSLRKTSTLTGVSKSTIQRWATANPIVLRSQKARKATTEAVQRIVQLVSSHPFDTPSKIATRIHDELKLHLSTSAVKFWMKRSGITYKKAARYVMTQDVEDKRKTYAQDSALYDPSRVISIDESSFYFDMKPSQGYCHRSRRLRVPARKGGRTRWSLLMAVSDEKVVGWKLVKGSINSHIFSEFMATLDTHERDVMLLDNCSIHKTQTAQDAMISRGLTPLFLSPYSPEFQPIEHCFSVLKRAFRKTNISTNIDMDSDVKQRLESCMPVLTANTLHNQFMACWARASQYTTV